MGRDGDHVLGRIVAPRFRGGGLSVFRHPNVTSGLPSRADRTACHEERNLFENAPSHPELAVCVRLVDIGMISFRS